MSFRKMHRYPVPFWTNGYRVRLCPTSGSASPQVFWNNLSQVDLIDNLTSLAQATSLLGT